MSKEEEKAIQHCCTKCTNNKLNCGMKLISHGRNCIACSNYIEGYSQAEKDVAEAFARIIRSNLGGIGNDIQNMFEQLYTDITGEKMYNGFID